MSGDLGLRTGPDIKPRLGGYQGDPGAGLLGGRPDWLMIGGRNPDGSYRLIASRDLNRAELEAKFDYDRMADIGLLEPLAVTSRRRITAHAEMRTFIIVDAQSYGACLAEMARAWADWDTGQQPRRPPIALPPAPTTPLEQSVVG